jgi:ribonuclease HI
MPPTMMAEYVALLHGMHMAKACGATSVMIYGDSILVMQQIMKQYDACNENMIAYNDMYNLLKGTILVMQQIMKQYDACNENKNMIAYNDMYNLLKGTFDGCELNHVGRASNEEADTLENNRSTQETIPDGVCLEQIHECSIKVKPPASTQQPTTHSGLRPSHLQQKASKIFLKFQHKCY